MVKSRFNAVLFDLDGTLLNTLEDLADSMNRCLARQGFPTHSYEAYNFFIGDGIENLGLRSLPENSRSRDTLKALLDDMRVEYSAHWADKTLPYPGINSMLTQLSEKKIKMAVLSNKPDEFTGVMVTRFFPKIRFDVIFGSRPGIPRKPDPCAALEIAGILKLKPGEFIYLGDTGTDMCTANAAGMFPVGALWGFRTETELRGNGAKVLIKTPEEFLKVMA